MLIPSDLPVAEFEGYDEFDHFESTEHPECFACNSRRMLVCPCVVTADYVLLEASMKGGENFVVMPGVYLIFPRIHVEDFTDMPDNWTASIKEAVAILGLQGRDINISDNWGRGAGQTVPHGHTWIIDRSLLKEKGLTIDTGLATLLYQSLLETSSM